MKGRIMAELKCVAKVRKLAESVGATLNDYEDELTIIVDAPKGYVWECNDCRGIYCAWTAIGGSETFYAQACRDAIEQMKAGLRRVTPEEQKEVEWDFDEDWTPPAGSPETIAV